MPSLRDDLRLARDRRFALLLWARTASTLGSAFAPVALAFGILHLPGGNATRLSIVLACESVPMVVFLLVGGVIADRLPRQRLMMTAEALSTLAFGSLALMLGGGVAPVWLMGLASAASGVGMSLLWPALGGIVPQVVTESDLQAGNGLLSMVSNTARILGVVVAGIVVAALGAAWALAASAMMFAAAAVLTSRLHVDASASASGLTVRGSLDDLAEGWNEFRSREWLWVVVAQFALLVMAFNAVHGVLGPVIANQELGGARAWSKVLAGESLGMLLGVAVGMRVRPRRPILAAVVSMVPTVPVPWLLLGLHARLWWVVVASFFMGASFDFFGVLWNTTMQREVPQDVLSRVSSYDAMGSLMFGPLGLLLAGPATVWLGPHRAMLACSIFLFVVTASALASPGVRRLEWATRDADTSEPTAVTAS